MTDIVVSLGKPDHLARIVVTQTMPWELFAAKFTVEPPISDDKSSQGWYCPARFSPEYRDSENFIARYALTFDYDKIERADVAGIEAAYRGYTYMMYTTASHTKDKPRIRLVLPLSRPATMDEFCAVTRKMGSRFDLEKLARESDTPAQMMFLPTCKARGVYRHRLNVGKTVDVDAVLGEYSDWTDRRQWPHRLRSDNVGAVEATPPNEKAGVVGDFCRAFRVPEAIDRFSLPYSPGSNDRYTLVGGSRPDGLRIYDDGLKAHSEHDTDPAHGQTNAFDLVRLHKFGKLDTPEDLAKPITERPSYREMIKLAAELPEMQAMTVANEFVDLGPLPETLADRVTGGATVSDAATPYVVALARPLVDVLRTPTVPRWLLRDRLERGVIALMAGPRGSYKSFIAIDWSMEVAHTGESVYVVSAEGADFDRRALAWLKAKGDGRAIEELDVYVLERRIDLNQHDNIELIRQDCLKLGVRPVLFVLDTFSKLSGGLDENSNTDVKTFIGRLDNGLKRAFDATVLLIAHTGHSDRGRARGASALEADTDAAYIVTRNEQLKNVAISRQRFKASPELESLWLEPEIIDLGYTDGDGVPVTSLVMRGAQKPVVPGTGLTDKQRVAMNLITIALAGTSDGTLADDELIRMLVGAAIRPAEGRDLRAQYAKKMLQSLVDRKCVHLKNGRVSLIRAEFMEPDEFGKE